MISTKLLVLLQGFSKSELRGFHKFIISPYCNENPDLIKLFEIILNFFQKSKSKNTENQILAKENVWKKIKGNEKYRDEQLRRLCSDLIKKIYQFIAHQQFSKSEINELIYLIPAINSSQLHKHYSGIIRQSELLQKNSKIKNAKYHFNNYKIEYSRFTHLEVMEEKVRTFENLEQADYHLDCYYYGEKLKNYCEALAYGNVIALKSQINLDQQFLDFLANSPFINESSIKTYYLVVKMLLAPNDESFFQNLKTHLKSFGDNFPQPELKSLYIYLINYCIDTKINNGRSDFFNELFDIFKVVIENEIMFSNGILAPQDYKNIITVGLHIQEFEWTEKFIQEYTNRLPKESQDNDLSYNLAKVYFHQEEYEKVIEQLRAVEYKNLSYTMGGRLMLLKTYYELKELDALESLLDSYGIYLRRNKLISRNVKQQLMNGIRFTRKLSSLAPYDKKGIQKLKDQINNCKALAAKKWLLEKVAELEK